MSTAIIHTPDWVGMARFGGQNWQCVLNTPEYSFMYNGSLSLYVWKKLPGGRFEWVDIMYVPVNKGSMEDSAYLTARVWMDRADGRAIQANFLIKGKLVGVEVNSWEYLTFCKEQAALHGDDFTAVIPQHRDAWHWTAPKAGNLL